MRFLVLSDIHANLTALDAVLEASKGAWDRVVCLGDLVGYGPDPDQVIDRVRSLDAVTIRGNHDKAVAGLEEAEDFNPVALYAVLWSRGQLSPENHAYLYNLPAGPFTVDGMSLVHGAFLDEDEYVAVPVQAFENLVATEAPLTTFGHTHVQGGFFLRGGGEKAEMIQARLIAPDRAALTLEPDAKYLLNPGSVGQPRDGDPRAAFAIFDTENRVFEFRRLPYDIDAVQQRMRDAGLPERLIERLEFGH